MDLVQSLTALSGYPIPRPLVLNALEEEELEATQQCTADIRRSSAYKRCKVKVYRFLASAPNVSQGGISYSFTNEDKAEFRRLAAAINDELGSEAEGQRASVEYGYQGDSF